MKMCFVKSEIMEYTAQLDVLDRKIIAELQQDCRLSNQEIAERAGSSPSSVWRRVKALQDSGIISGFQVNISADQVGLPQTVLVQVSLDSHSDASTAAFNRLVQGTPQVLECYAVTGEYDYQLKVVAADMPAIYRFLEETLMSQPFVARTASVVVLKKIKESSVLPVEVIP